MYCVKCGVKLADSEQRCPLCQTKVYHPDIVREAGDSLYPKNQYPAAHKRSFVPQVIISMLVLLPILIVLLCDWQLNQAITWSGYVIGALLMAYVWTVLPMWFRKPNPVIFVPCGFAAVGGYLWYIHLATGGDWFWSFALPVVGGIALIVTAVVTLLRYLHGGELYIFGGAAMALGLFMLPVEILMTQTFSSTGTGWALYPLVALVLLGGMLIFLAACRPARETMERKFFI